MFGMEKKEDTSFEYDLEKDLKSEKGDVIIQEIEEKIKSVENQLRAGAGKEAYTQLSTLLKGYEALLLVSQTVRKQEKKA